MSNNSETEFLFYDAKRQNAYSGVFIDNINPATGQVIHPFETASKEDVDKIVRSSARAFDQWSKTAPADRGRILKKAAQILRDKNEEIAQIEVEDTGKPISEALSVDIRSEEHTSELQSRGHLVCRLLLEKK